MSQDISESNAFRISDLFGDLIDGLVSAQKSLDRNALEERERLLLGPRGILQVPPLWFHFRWVSVDLEIRALTLDKQATPSLKCRMIDPITANLIETDVSTRSRISVTIAPISKLSDAAPIKVIDA